MLTAVQNQALKSNGVYVFVIRFLASLRMLAFPKHVARYISQGIASKLYHPPRRYDPLYFIVHAHFLSKRLTLMQRMQCAIGHHEYESDTYDRAYVERVYKSKGISLWRQSVDWHDFSIMLVATEDFRSEGDLSVLLSVDDMAIWRMSFSYVNASTFGLAPNKTLLVSRNQSEPNGNTVLFGQCFKQNLPQYFCLSAVCGVAMANGFETVLGIKHDCQVAYGKPYDQGFRNSYTVLWSQFDSVEIDRHVYEIGVPLKLPPLQSLDRAHRNRARNRRNHWNEIQESARTAMICYLSASGARSKPASAN